MSAPPPPIEALPAELGDALARWWERAAAEQSLAGAYAACSARLREELPRVIACSEFVGAALLRDPDALAWLDLHEDPPAAAAAGAAFERSAADAADAAEARRILRIWRRRAMLRIAWRDIVGRAGLVETLTALSDFADGAIRAAVAATARLLEPAFGSPRDAAGAAVPLIVVAMGKLGGRELNFSSDIDLVLLYAAGGETDGARKLDNQEYFLRAAREFIRLLDARDEDGFVFRVDMRLRPFGDSGPLVVSLGGLEEYLQQHGRDWERYAWIKARAIVGAQPYEATYREAVRPFVFRRYLDYGVFDSLREMKALIAREVARRDRDADLKLGTGGIREIEFIVQSFQLVRGGSDGRLRQATLLDVLPALEGSKLLPPDAVENLAAAYRVLRRAENAVQMVRDEQTHRLPESAADRARFALHLGVADWDAALSQVQAARRIVAAQFDQLVFAAGRGVPRDAPPAAGLNFDAPRLSEELLARGIAPTAAGAVAPLLEAYRGSAAYRKLDEVARRRLHAILDRLVAAAAGRERPAALIERLLRILETIGSRSSYLALLKERPQALVRLIEVCAISGFLAR
ncbi:MAG TPA: bifunctional [glutamate--ammonia ligase]-adenylyl-L-tyrosine phosphorylase/[glutamate--ammonia-ligase] adenylyltransferase, partial [Steroidobacteraceae bacterium]|nr:bifunctional [glutamate--ammonia ligase]-adenylyl-L-tyrosine phosphorylase/[glutamate--ammonia-ligase] adenylyltransferase [Steroidobacteraceae bacterium]